ncbi:MAG: AsmA family protein [Oligoflexia bacterium]|nr:AsmA family protein [Oligoflexia bacterium]
MKKLVRALIIAVVLLALVLGYTAYSANSLIAKFRPELEQIASRSLGSAVHFGAISVSIFPHATLNLAELVLKGSAQESEGFKLSNLVFDLDTWKLLQGKVDILRLSIDSPSVQLIKGEDGVSVHGLTKTKQASAPNGTEKQNDSVGSQTGAPPTLPSGLSVNLREFSLKNANVTVIDSATKQEITIRPLNINASLEISAGTIRLPNFSVTGQALGRVDFALNGKGVSYDTGSARCDFGDVTAEIFKGQAKLKGNADLKTQSMAVTLSSSGFSLEQMVAAVKPEVASRVAGQISEFNTSVTLRLGADIPASIKGPLTFKVSDASLKGFNLAGSVLSTIRDLPFLSQSLLGSVPPSEQAALTASDTTIREISGKFEVADGTASTDNFQMLSPVFDLTARGTAAMTGNVSMDAEISFNKAISGGLTAKVQELKPLSDNEGRLILPLAINGQAPDIRVTPKMSRILDATVGGAIKEKAGKALEKLLGGSDGKKKGLGGILGF